MLANVQAEKSRKWKTGLTTTKIRLC